MVLGFHALGDHLQLHGVRQRDHGADDGGVVGIGGQVAHKRAVYFQGVDREALQVAQAGVAGAEVVDRQADAHVGQFLQGGGGAGRVRHDHAFRDFQLELGGVAAGFGQDLAHQLDQVLLVELARGQVHGDGQRRQAGLAPGHQLLAGGAQHPGADLDDEPGLLGNRNELGGRHRLAARRTPAQQRFDADLHAAGEVDLRLVIQHEFVALDRTTQAAFHAQAVQGARIHFFGIELEIAAAQFLGAVHGGVGILQQGIAVDAVARVDADADAADRREFVAEHVHRQQQGFQQFRRQHGGGAALRDVRHQDHEFVAAQARHRVALAHDAGQAPPGFDDDVVARLVAEAVVDGLEAVEIDEQYRHLVLRAVRQRQRLVEAVHQQAAVGQAGEHVVAGHVAQLVLVLLAPRNILDHDHEIDLGIARHHARHCHVHPHRRAILAHVALLDGIARDLARQQQPQRGFAGQHFPFQRHVAETHGLQFFLAVADDVLELAVGAQPAPVARGLGQADRRVVKGDAEAFLAVAQGGLGAHRHGQVLGDQEQQVFAVEPGAREGAAQVARLQHGQPGRQGQHQLLAVVGRTQADVDALAQLGQVQEVADVAVPGRRRHAQHRAHRRIDGAHLARGIDHHHAGRQAGEHLFGVILEARQFQAAGLFVGVESQAHVQAHEFQQRVVGRLVALGRGGQGGVQDRRQFGQVLAVGADVPADFQADMLVHQAHAHTVALVVVAVVAGRQAVEVFGLQVLEAGKGAAVVEQLAQARKTQQVFVEGQHDAALVGLQVGMHVAQQPGVMFGEFEVGAVLRGSGGVRRHEVGHGVDVEFFSGHRWGRRRDAACIH